MATVRLDQKRRALVRGVPLSFTKALARYFGSGPTDVELARTQHRAYIHALEDNGVNVHCLEADERHPDCMFVEDQAVVIDGYMLLPVPGHPSRVAEQPPIADFLMDALDGVQTCDMGGEARMDGGDIIRLGDCFLWDGQPEPTTLASLRCEVCSTHSVTSCASLTFLGTPSI